MSAEFWTGPRPSRRSRPSLRSGWPNSGAGSARARHRPGRRRPGQHTGTSTPSTSDCAEDRHRQHPPRPAGHRDAGRGRGGRRRTERRPGLHGVPGAAADRLERRRFAILCAVDPDKDVDGLHPTNLGWLVLGQARAAAMHADRHHRIVAPLRGADRGAHVVVIGRGITVGRPLALMLTRRSENATVTVCHTGTRDLAAARAAGRHRRGRRRLAAPRHRRHGQAGCGRPRRGSEPGGRQARGDVAPEVAEVAGYLSPNPGGVGPMTRAMLLRNVVEAAEQRASWGMAVRRAGGGHGAVGVPGRARSRWPRRSSTCSSGPGTGAAARASLRPPSARRRCCGPCCRRRGGLLAVRAPDRRGGVSGHGWRNSRRRHPAAQLSRGG